MSAVDPVTAALNIGGKVIDRLWPDPAQAAAAKLELFKLQQSGELSQMTGQLEINKVEAAHPSVFVSGWRPAVGWVCVAACAWNWVGMPVAKLGIALAGMSIQLEAASLTEMLPVLLGLLGLGGLRTIERLNGVERK
jgi:hypothetical protein